MIKRNTNTNPGTRIICEWCGNIIIGRRKRFCDNTCKGKWIGNNQTDETRKKKSQTLTGHDVPQEVREAIRKTVKDTVDNYKYDPSAPQDEYRKLAIEFYGYECSVCGCTEGILHVHHINNNHYDDRIENLVVLCPSCHAKAHFVQDDSGRRIGGLLNEDFIQIIMSSRKI